ncbi:MAG: HD domain-containing protein [Bacteroidetes bacterium]|nr:HD domain-containing protein [Bacteroidota bacterium]
MNFTEAKHFVLNRLRTELSPTLFYHCLAHTLDVCKVAQRIMKSEKTDPYTGLLIETAALFHDAGMIVQYKDHEMASVEIARATLPRFLYTPNEIDNISELIRVTTLPQRPKSFTEQIICDADLDYLGREDYLMSSFALKLEWEINGIRTCTLKEWLYQQIEFLEDHQFFTSSTIALRQEKKLKNLAEIKEIVQK